MSHFPVKSFRILFKAFVLFVVFNYVFTLVPDDALWKISLYNTILPGQTRFPLENNLNLMFDTHEIAGSPYKVNEYKVVVLGDSASWGFLLNSNETYSSVINASRLVTCQGRNIHIYNLGYPSLSVFKDLILLQHALAYRPNLILWNVTLSSMLRKQEQARENVILKENSAIAQSLIDRYHLSIAVKPLRPPAQNASLQNDTFLARKDMLARYIQYQLNGIRWQAAGEQVDKDYDPLSLDVKADLAYNELLPGALSASLIEFDVLKAGVSLADNIPLVIINEPIQIVTGQNSDIRYNKMYPRWAYDQYRQMMSEQSDQQGWNYVDLWNILPPDEFSNTPIHHTAQGDRLLANTVQDIILKNACP